MHPQNSTRRRTRQLRSPDSTDASIEFHRRHRRAAENVVGIALARPLAFVAEAAGLDISPADFDRWPDLTAAVVAVLEVADLATGNTPPNVVAECALTLAAYRCSRRGDLDNLHPDSLAELAHEGGRSVDIDDPFDSYPSARERLDFHIGETRWLAGLVRDAERHADEARRANLKMVRVLDRGAA